MVTKACGSGSGLRRQNSAWKLVGRIQGELFDLLCEHDVAVSSRL
jgi:hypothetical protein